MSPPVSRAKQAAKAAGQVLKNLTDGEVAVSDHLWRPPQSGTTTDWHNTANFVGYTVASTPARATTYSASTFNTGGGLGK
jgi:hypothetical protein